MAVSQRIDPLATFNDAYDAGSRRAQQGATLNALAMSDTDPTGAANALMRVGNFEGASALQKIGAERQRQQVRQAVQPMIDKGDYGAAMQATALIDPELADQLSKMDDRQRKIADENASKVGAAAFYVRTGSKEGTPERDALIKQAVDGLIAHGLLTPEKAAQIDRSDAGLRKYEMDALGLKEAITQFDKDRTFNATEADRTLRRAADLEKFNWQKQYQGGMLKNAQSNAARGWAAHNARVKAGGYGTPGVGGSVIADDNVEIDP